MTEERRNQYRDIFEERLLGELHLHAEGRVVAVRHVEDISPFGISLLVDDFVATGSGITLRYQHGTIDVEVLGTVVWSAVVHAEDVARLGINLQEGEMASNVTFFNAITA